MRFGNMLIAGVALTVGLSTAAMALDVPPEEAAKYADGTYTDYGAIRAGNADGTIPAYTGGFEIGKAPAGTNWKLGDWHPDPFADEKPLFSINASNYEQYGDKVTPGQIGTMKAYDTYRMDVYTTHRTASFPQRVYDAMRENLKNADLTPDGNGLLGARLAPPFPVPTKGVHVSWNHTRRYRGFKYYRWFAGAAPTRGGSYTLFKQEDELIWRYFDPNGGGLGPDWKPEQLENIDAWYIQKTTAPARSAGQVILVHESNNAIVLPRQAWVYNPGQRRVRRAPQISYDNPGINADGLSTFDQFDAWNGSPDRYEFTLQGRVEKYTPYNNYKLTSHNVSYEDIITPGHLNSDLMRYELHRMWQVEGNLREGFRHLYPRRVMYSDEDSWMVMMAEAYDARGQLWRVQEIPTTNRWEHGATHVAAEAVYDLLAGRYVVNTMSNEEKLWDLDSDVPAANRYTPDAIRRMGVR